MRMSAEIAAEDSALLHMKVIQRANELPVLKSAASYLTMFYQQAKNYCPLVSRTLSMAESSAAYAGHIATPVIKRLDGGVHTVDDIACTLLTAIQLKYPVIMKDTDEVSAHLVSVGGGVRDGVLSQAGSLLQTKPAQLALLGVAAYLRLANKVADITMPEDNTECTSFSCGNPALLNVMVLSDKLYRRVSTQSLAQLQQIQEVSTRALHTLHNQLNTLEVAKANMWAHVQSTTQLAQEHTLVAAGQVYAAAARSGTLQLAQQISSQLVSVYGAAAASASGVMQSTLLTSKSYAEQIYAQLEKVAASSELTTVALSQIRETLNLLQTYLATVFSKLPQLVKQTGLNGAVSQMKTVQETAAPHVQFAM